MVFSVVATRKCVGPRTAACARGPVTSRQRGRSVSGEPARVGRSSTHATMGATRRTGRLWRMGTEGFDKLGAYLDRVSGGSCSCRSSGCGR